MLTINKKFVVDEHGNPKEVIILWEDFRKIANGVSKWGQA